MVTENMLKIPHFSPTIGSAGCLFNTHPGSQASSYEHIPLIQSASGPLNSLLADRLSRSIHVLSKDVGGKKPSRLPNSNENLRDDDVDYNIQDTLYIMFLPYISYPPAISLLGPRRRRRQQ